MSKFDFLFIVPAIVIGIAITRLLEFCGDVMGSHLGWLHWLHIFWLFATAIFLMQNWFFMLDWRERDLIQTFPQFLIAMSLPISQFLMTVFVCPDLDSANMPPLKEIFFVNAPFFYACCGAAMLSVALEGKVLETKDMLAFPSENIARLVSGLAFVAVACLPAAWSREYIAFGWVIVCGLFRLVMVKKPI